MDQRRFNCERIDHASWGVEAPGPAELGAVVYMQTWVHSYLIGLFIGMIDRPLLLKVRLWMRCMYPRSDTFGSDTRAMAFAE